MDWLRARLAGLRDAFWLVPAAIVVALLLLAVVVVQVDRRSGTSGVGVAFGGGPAAARSVLSAIAGSVITVAGLTFSIMIVTLQLVSAQYTPRALRTFLDDRVTQVVAGSFVGIFGYSLLVLRTVRGGDGAVGDPFVPSLALSVAIGLGVVALGLLIVFVHHMTVSIQVSSILARLADATLESVDRLHPAVGREPRAESADALLRAWRQQGRPRVVRPTRPGFVRHVRLDALARRAGSRLQIHVAAPPGAFVTGESTLVEVWPPGPGEGLDDAVHAYVHVAKERELRDDAGFGIRQLADVGLRALSPGLNDPTTARTCVGYLTAILERLATRDLTAEVRRLDETVAVARRPSFAEYLDVAFDELAVAAAGQPRVALEIADALATVASAARRQGFDEHARACERTARAVSAPLLAAAPSDDDRARLAGALERVGGDPALQYG